MVPEKKIDMLNHTLIRVKRTQEEMKKQIAEIINQSGPKTGLKISFPLQDDAALQSIEENSKDMENDVMSLFQAFSNKSSFDFMRVAVASIFSF